MVITKTKLNGPCIIDVVRIEDDRGFFGRCWCKNEFETMGLNANPVQANVSYNKVKGTLRGMHYQKPPFAETKTVRCTAGAIYDVIVDIRPGSETYLQWLGVELTGRNFRMIYIPEGFAHGFITLEDHTSVHYMVTASYRPEAEGGIRYDDPGINIEWPIEPTIVSDKDRNHKLFVPQVIVKADVL